MKGKDNAKQDGSKIADVQTITKKSYVAVNNLVAAYVYTM
tara:strand:+ start:647 stop:766 length:120 start_codon:yes stop_codon:yes gene_type:complete